MTELFAERTIYAIIDGNEIQAIVRVWMPEQIDDQEWRCPFTFEVDSFRPELKDGIAGGVDSMQALIIALYGVGSTLDRTGVDWSMFSRDQLRQENAPAVDDGFPRGNLDALSHRLRCIPPLRY